MAGRDLFADNPPQAQPIQQDVIQPQPIAPQGQGKDLFAANPPQQAPQAQVDPRKAQVAGEMQNRGYGPLDMLMMGVEPALALGSAAISEPIAGFGGILATIFGEEQGAGAETVKQIQDAMSYEAKTRGGKAAMSAIGETIGPAVQKVGDVVQGIGDAAYEVGGPIAGAATITAIAAIPEILGLKGTKVAKKLALKNIIKKADTTGLVDEAGNLAPNVSESLAKANIPEEEFLQMVPDEVLAQSKTKQLFDESGVPLTKGELSKDSAQVAKEQKLLQSVGETASEPFRQFKLKQSEAIKDVLNKSFGDNITTEEMGELVKDALSGRKKMLTKQKTELYDLVNENAAKEGLTDIPIFTDNIATAIPDEKTLRGLNRASKGTTNDVMDTLAEYGVIEPTAEMLERGLVPDVLSLSNFDEFEQILGMMKRSDPSGATTKMVEPIRKALSEELDMLDKSLTGKNISDEITKPLKKARGIVRELKVGEFSPKSMVGKLIGDKKNSSDQIIEATKVHEKLLAKSSPVEDTRRVVNSLKEAGVDGEKALSGMQASVILDLIDSGFSVDSRNVSGINVFNPTAFKRRLKAIGEDKVSAIFTGNKEAFRKIRNIDKISKELIPDANLVPKGSASVIMDMANKLGFSAITGKIGGPLFIEAARRAIAPTKTGVSVKGALKAELPEMPQILTEHFPGIAGAIGVSKSLQEEE